MLRTDAQNLMDTVFNSSQNFDLKIELIRVFIEFLKNEEMVESENKSKESKLTIDILIGSALELGGLFC